MAALPRQPLSLVIAQGGPEGTPSVLVYDDTVPRTNTVPSGYPFSLLETSVSGATVYAYGKGGNPWTEIYPLAVNAGGISVRPGSPPDLIFYYNYDMRFRGSRLYFASGHIVNPTGWVVEATLGGGQWVETDPTVTRVFYLGHDGGLNATLTAWSPATGQLSADPLHTAGP